MPDVTHTMVSAVQWIGVSFLALIFLANALGVLDQSIPARELKRAGVPVAAARAMVWAGRVLQIVAVPCLFFASTRPYAAGALAMFLIGATLVAHEFWRTPADAPEERGRQLVNFLKNVAIVGGLCVAAGWRN